MKSTLSRDRSKRNPNVTRKQAIRKQKRNDLAFSLIENIADLEYARFWDMYDTDQYANAEGIHVNGNVSYVPEALEEVTDEYDAYESDIIDSLAAIGINGNEWVNYFRR